MANVILFDNAGVGSSTGETPSNVSAMTRHFVQFRRALDLKKFNVMGFSLGGMIAQQLAFEYPDMVFTSASYRLYFGLAMILFGFGIASFVLYGFFVSDGG